MAKRTKIDNNNPSKVKNITLETSCKACFWCIHAIGKLGTIPECTRFLIYHKILLCRNTYYSNNIWNFIFTTTYQDAQCMWPAPFRNSTWYDSGLGTLTFTTSGLTGFSVTYPTHGTVSTWRCHDVSEFITSNILVIR